MTTPVCLFVCLSFYPFSDGWTTQVYQENLKNEDNFENVKYVINEDDGKNEEDREN